MTELASKINMVLATTTAHNLYDEDTVELTNFLWEHDCIRDRVIDKTELRLVVLGMRQ